ncbi:hypothetical protein BH23ACT5_BH23ACT5_19420 [soil metagenome]
MAVKVTTAMPASIASTRGETVLRSAVLEGRWRRALPRRGTWCHPATVRRRWDCLHELFTIPELVELGFFIALTSGQQRWIKTLDIGHRQVLSDTEAGLVDVAG